jgi:C1A family cysteine protease
MKALLFLAAAVSAYGNGDVIAIRGQKLWQSFKAEYNKQYSAAEEHVRQQIFMDNLKVAALRNEQEGAEVHGVTKFSDMTPSEFKSMLTYTPKLREVQGQPVPRELESQNAVQCTSTTSCDYRTLKAVTPVKDQGQCGSCWAFSATESAETAWFMSNHTLPVLAPQQVVDCDNKDGGFNGGDTPTAFQYIIANGLEAESSYFYKVKDETCQYKSSVVIATAIKWEWGIAPCNTVNTRDCSNQNETALWDVVERLGPQSICVDAEPWQTYRSGIMKGACPHGYYELDHCVQLVGYGVDAGQKYWLVRNSWGTSWGEAGYIRLAFGTNECGVADEVNYLVA